MDADGRWVWVSACTPDEWLGRLDEELQPPRLLNPIRDTLDEDLTSPVEEVRLVGTVERRFRVTRFLLADGRVGLHGVDITDEHARRTQVAVADRIASVAAISAGIAHEINNPLSWVLGNLDFAKREMVRWHGAPSPDVVRDVRDSVLEALDGANRMRRIIRELRTFSHREPATDLVDVHRVVRSAVQITGREVRRAAELVLDLGRVPMVRADAALLGQVLVNLLQNAADAFGEGNARGMVKIATRTDGKGSAIIEVIDNATGISEAELDSIFYPFFTTKPGGTGLGLAICQHVVHSFGGLVTVRSTLGEGTAFQLELPAGRKPTESNPRFAAFGREDTSAATRPPGVLSLLVIDDEPFIGSLLQRMLDEHEVVVYQTGAEALNDLHAGGSYDVILCDLMMQEMTGMDVYAEIQAHFAPMARRVVFMTGGAYTPDAQEFLDGAANPCIPKPFDLRVLRSTIQSVASLS